MFRGYIDTCSCPQSHVKFQRIYGLALRCVSLWTVPCNDNSGKRTRSLIFFAQWSVSLISLKNHPLHWPPSINWLFFHCHLNLDLSFVAKWISNWLKARFHLQPYSLTTSNRTVHCLITWFTALEWMANWCQARGRSEAETGTQALTASAWTITCVGLFGYRTSWSAPSQRCSSGVISRVRGYTYMKCRIRATWKTSK